MSKVMVLGAGAYQVPLIRKVKELGHTAIVVSPAGNYPGIEIADIFLEFDTRNKEEILLKARELNIDAVLTTGTDVAVPTIGYINDSLKLNGISFKTALNSTDKILMKNVLKNNDVNTASFQTVSSYNELEKIASQMGYPIMVKAVDSSGSRGIIKVINQNSLESAYKEALRVTKSKEIIVEEFLDGYEIGADLFVVGNQIEDIFLHEKFLSSSNVKTPIGHLMPLEIDQELKIKIENLLTNAVKSLRLCNTASNADIMIVDGDPYLIEISARMGGTCLPEVIGSFIGFNVYEYLIDLSLGLNPKLPVEYLNHPTAAKVIISPRSGILKSLPDNTKILQNPSLVSYQFDANVGDYINKFVVGPDRVGHIIVQSKTRQKCIEELSRLENLATFEVS